MSEIDYEYENRIMELVTELCDAMGFDWYSHDDDSKDIQDVLIDAVPHARCLRRLAEGLGHKFEGFGPLSAMPADNVCNKSDAQTELEVFVGRVCSNS